MKKQIQLTLFIFLFINLCLSIGCLDRFKYEIPNYKSKLVVEGSVSNLPGPYTVTIYKSEPYLSQTNTSPLNGATVEIIESGSVNRTIVLQNPKPAVYVTDSASFQGVVGNTYYIKIKTLDGQEYWSRPEKILPPVPIDDVKLKYVGGANYLTAFQLNVNYTDPSLKGNFYRWKWTHFDTSSSCLVRSVSSPGGRIVTYYPCCEKCWIIRPCFGCVNVKSDGLFNGKKSEQIIGSVPYDATKDYFVHVEQQSISQSYYTFWNIAETQIYNSGGIFDNPPAQVPGNLYNPKDTTDEALGYFAAIGTTMKTAFLSRQGVRAQPPPIFVPRNTLIEWAPDCRFCISTLNDMRTNVKPKGWID